MIGLFILRQTFFLLNSFDWSEHLRHERARLSLTWPTVRPNHFIESSSGANFPFPNIPLPNLPLDFFPPKFPPSEFPPSQICPYGISPSRNTCLNSPLPNSPLSNFPLPNVLLLNFPLANLSPKLLCLKFSHPNLPLPNLKVFHSQISPSPISLSPISPSPISPWYCKMWHCIVLYLIVSYKIFAWYCIVGFSARAVSCKTPIYFIVFSKFARLKACHFSVLGTKIDTFKGFHLLLSLFILPVIKLRCDMFLCRLLTVVLFFNEGWAGIRYRNHLKDLRCTVFSLIHPRVR